MTSQISKLIELAFKKLIEDDGNLFSGVVAECEDDRKLHEVCINHRLAFHLENSFCEFLNRYVETMYFDLEFNREGPNQKELNVDNHTTIVRPDIVLHNRKSGQSKLNLLVIECKKSDASEIMIKQDKEKLHAFLTDERYCYKYALYVEYCADRVFGELYTQGESMREITS